VEVKTSVVPYAADAVPVVSAVAMVGVMVATSGRTLNKTLTSVPGGTAPTLPLAVARLARVEPVAATAVKAAGPVPTGSAKDEFNVPSPLP